jgi:hypothetical protein
MTKYLISFPAQAMDVPETEMSDVGEAARKVIGEAKHARIYVFGGGINTTNPALMVNADGTVTNKTYPRADAYFTSEFPGLSRDSLNSSRPFACAWRCSLYQEPASAS